MSIDIARARADTPGCEAQTHFNNAGAALSPQPVLDTVISHLNREAEIGGYEAAAEADSRLEHLYAAAAQLVGGNPREIAYLENATRAWDMAFYAIDWQAGDQIVTAQAEYASNYIAYLHMARKRGVEIVTVPNDQLGQVSVEALMQRITERTRLIAITHIPTNGGLVNPAAAVGEVAKAHNILYLLDACQSVGQIPVDVATIGCDMLSATGRKYLRGPRGTGFLWVREDLIETLDPPLLDLHAAKLTGPDSYEVRTDARRFENWESFVAGRLGLARAIDYALDLGMDAIRDRIYALAERLRDGLDSLPGATVRDLGQEKCGIVSFTLDGHEPIDIKESVAAKRINVSASRRPSTLLDMTDRGLDSVVRASVHYYNTEDEVDRLLSAVAAL
jgi:selenocysteine lyase/cysteine desulfurase